MKTYKEEAAEYGNIRDFEQDKDYSLDEVAEHLGFTAVAAKLLFYTSLIKHGIITHDLNPTYLSFMEGFIQWPESGKGEKVVSYEGTMMIGDLLEAYGVLPPES